MKKKTKDRKDYSNRDVICIVGKQNHISSTEFHFIVSFKLTHLTIASIKKKTRGYNNTSRIFRRIQTEKRKLRFYLDSVTSNPLPGSIRNSLLFFDKVKEKKKKVIPQVVFNIIPSR